MHNVPTPGLIPSADACELLSVDRSTLTRWVASGRIKPAGKVPGKRGGYLFAVAEVERVNAERKAAA